MQILNDKTCGWIDYSKRLQTKTLNSNINCDYLIVGAGFTGLSAARKLAEINKSKKIILIDAQFAGEGASSRNSGYLVDTTLNDGFTSDRNINNYKKKTQIYDLGIKAVKKFIKEFQVNCDWNESGKYFASSKLEDENVAKKFSDLLNKLDFQNNILYQEDLKKRLGTNFYKIAVYTKGGILLNPGKLIRSMIKALPDNVILFENTTLLKWKKLKDKVHCTFEKHNIETNKIIFCTNGFLSKLGIKKRYNFPITLTASMTRSLNDEEYKIIGQPKEWGVLPIRPMGATIRMTKDRRILIRNTAEIRNPESMSKTELNKRIYFHKVGIKKRFPDLPPDIISSSWSGVVCRSGNSSQIFEKIDNNIYVAGCYNGSGIGLGTLFGEQIALMAENENSEEISIIQSKKQPNWLPPQPFLNVGIFTRLLFEKIIAKSEI
mgnify:CR=1 FL=1|tara:strand:- start:6 stop:1307 length:1302 start_codon:yes stop_codon:yes gene_type:complete